MSNKGFMQRSDSWVHFALGGVSAYTKIQYLPALYGAYQYSAVSANDDCPKCPNQVIQGAEYALGYFGVGLLIQIFGANYT